MQEQMNMKLKEIIEYVKQNYDTLPESNFDTEGKCIIIFVNEYFDEAYEHYFEGLGVTKEGKLKWFFSSGCSCSGGSRSEDATLKSFEVLEDPYDKVEKYWKNGIPKLDRYEFEEY